MNRKFTHPLMKVLLALFFSFSFSEVKAVFTRVALTGFNEDVIANGIGAPTTSTSAAFDLTNYCLVAHSYQATAANPNPTFALADSGTIWSQTTSGLSWQLAPYTSANSLKLINNNQVGTLTFANQTLRGDIYLLLAAGDATPNTTADITVTFTDNTTYPFPGQLVYDWYYFAGTTAIAIGGRVARSTGLLDQSGSYPRLFQIKLTMPLTLYAKQIKNIVVTKTNALGTLNIMAAAVDHQPCVPALGLNATNITTSTATVSWTAVPSSSGYEYAVTTSPVAPSSGTATTATSVNVTGLNVGTGQYLWVRNNCGGGVYSMWISYQFSTLPCPGSTNLHVTYNTPDTLSFSWTGSGATGVVGYQWAITTTGSVQPSTWNTTTSTSITVTTLIPGVTYYIWVRTNCGSTQALPVQISSYHPYPPCSAPPSIVASNISMHAARIDWGANANDSTYGYAVNIQSANPFNGGTITNAHFVELTNLSANTTYYIHMRTHCGYSNYSTWYLDSFNTTNTCVLPVTPHVDSFFADKAYISWHKRLGAMNYEYVLNNTLAAPTTNGYPVLDTIAVPANLYSGTKYYVHLRARCDSNNAGVWAVDSFITPTHCVPTSMPTISALGAKTVTINWQPANFASWYEIKLSNSPAPPSVGTATSYLNYTSNTLTPSTTYYFHIRSYCSAGDISPWKTLSFTTEPLGINNLSNDIKVEVFPNPVNDDLHIKIDGNLNSSSKVILLDITGKVLSEKNITQKESTIDMKGTAPGIYILKYEDEDTFGALRIIKE